MSTVNGSSIIGGITSGLNGTFSILANAAGTDGVTLESIAAAQTNTKLAGSLNGTFASYIQTNFRSLDKDGDGKLSAAELSNMTNLMSTTGMTQTQLAQLGVASGLSTDALNQVISHFAEIDSNGDGKVTTAEINAYNLTSAKEKKDLEFRNRAAGNMSIYYGNDDESSASESSSLLSYKYLFDSIPGITEVKISGEEPYQYHISYNNDKDHGAEIVKIDTEDFSERYKALAERSRQ